MPYNDDAPVVVLTGGIASGKSMVAQILANLGAHVISADEIAREVVEPGKPALKKIISTFGLSMLTPNGELDRRRLANLVFNDVKARRQLEEITHPQIWSLIEKKIKEAQQKAPLVVVEIPLYFESGHFIPQAEVWVVYVDETTQFKRLMARDGLSYYEAKKRLDAQMPLKTKCVRADRVIDNSYSKNETEAQVKKAWCTLISHITKKED
ncbi:MAG: dephospho-CoA kinase [Firmicutes bacterium]|jgi:dephospho-CoA kinase|nr:dephospho-CoA kinase [Bacillota bacterium]